MSLPGCGDVSGDHEGPVALGSLCLSRAGLGCVHSSSQQTGQCFIKLSVHGHPGPPLQILPFKQKEKEKCELHLAEHSQALQHLGP